MPQDSPPPIDIQGVSFAWPDGRQALCGLTFTVARGECLGLIGPNGAGKTTLFLNLCGILHPQSGTIRLLGFDPQSAAGRRQIPASVGLLFQNPDDQLFHPTVFDEVAFGPLNLGRSPEEVRQAVRESLARVGMSGAEDRVPFHLSGGEKRRLALACVLAMGPSVLLLDEPSIYLDPRGRRELITLLNGFPETRVLATHDLELMRRTCTRVLVMDQGRIVEEGPPDRNWEEHPVFTM
jgi:cobalt/nickel transport system ATP-binding protein